MFTRRGCGESDDKRCRASAAPIGALHSNEVPHNLPNAFIRKENLIKILIQILVIRLRIALDYKFFRKVSYVEVNGKTDEVLLSSP